MIKHNIKLSKTHGVGGQRKPDGGAYASTGIRIAYSEENVRKLQEWLAHLERGEEVGLHVGEDTRTRAQLTVAPF